MHRRERQKLPDGSAHPDKLNAIAFKTQPNRPDDVEGIDADDPRLTGVSTQSEGDICEDPETGEVFEDHTKASGEFETFTLKLARSLLIFGAPSHRIQSQLVAVALLFGHRVDIIHIPSLIMLSFIDRNGDSSEVHFIKGGVSVDLGRLQKVHGLYKDVMHGRMTLVRGSEELGKLLRAKPIYGMLLKILFAFLGGAILSPVAFSGSFVDMLAAGVTSTLVAWMQIYASARSRNFGTMVEISAIAIASFIARGLSMLKQGYFCYTAISSSPTVRALPKYHVVAGSLELASKHIVSGSTKMVFGIVYSLFVGFSLTIGSDLYFFVDSEARHRREAATRYLQDQTSIHGVYEVDQSSRAGNFGFTSDTTPPPNSHYRQHGCYRDPDWGWYLQPFPIWAVWTLIPLFCTISALATFQPLRSRELGVMVFISCCSYAVDMAFKHATGNRGDVASAMGAFVIGVMGHLYSRIFGGTAFVVMFNAIGFLVPGNLNQVGGLANNFRGSGQDEYNQSIALSLRMIQIAIGMTVGLFGSALVVYSFGKKKSGGLFAF